jgi:hypothetical protein
MRTDWKGRARHPARLRRLQSASDRITDAAVARMGTRRGSTRCCAERRSRRQRARRVLRVQADLNAYLATRGLGVKTLLT